MNKNLERLVEIPDGVDVEINENEIKVKGNGKEISRKFNMYKIEADVKGNVFKLVSKNATRREAKMMGTIWAHVKNMVKGVQEEFTYILEIANVHFPMNVKSEGNKIIIKSFLGETTKRISKICKNSKVNINGSKIIVTSYDIESAGQTAANLEKATRLTGRDRRIFQDGIYIIEKPGRII
jgi:large subunit ribosomal protein L6